MGQFYTDTISSTSAVDKINTVSEYFNGLSGISSEVIDYEYDTNTYKAVDISIDGTDIEAIFGIGIDDPSTTILKVVNGDNVLIEDTVVTSSWGTNLPVTISSYINLDSNSVPNETVLFISKNSNSVQDGPCGIELNYIKIDNSNRLIGYAKWGDAGIISLTDISSLTFEKLGDSARLQYTYANMFPYTAPSSYIDFLSQSYFKNGSNIRCFETDILRECSTVTLTSSVALQDGLFVALGAHCLAPIDQEEEGDE